MNLVLYSKITPKINLAEIERINQKLLNMINKNDPTIGYIEARDDRDREYFKKVESFYNNLEITVNKKFPAECQSPCRESFNLSFNNTCFFKCSL